MIYHLFNITAQYQVTVSVRAIGGNCNKCVKKKKRKIKYNR